MKRVLLGCSALLAAAAVAVQAASAGTQFTVRAGGLVLDDPFHGTTATLGLFRIDLHAGPGHKVTYVDKTKGISFRSLDLTNLVYTRTAVKITGIGLANGQRVHFTAIATDHKKTGVDAFKIAWNHQAAHGGNLRSGNVRVTPISVS